MKPRCDECGALLERLNVRCIYCKHWNPDPANPQPPPQEHAPAAAPLHAAPQPPAPAAAPQHVAPQPAAPAAPAAAPHAPAPPAAAVMTPLGPPVMAAAASGEKTPAKDAAPKMFGVRREGAVAPGKTPAKDAPPPGKTPAKVAPAAADKTASKKTEMFRLAVSDTGVSDDFARAVKVRAGKPDPASVSDEDDAALARVEAVAAAVYFVCTADDEDEFDEDEYDALVEAIGELLGDEVDEDELEARCEEWEEAISDDEEHFLADLNDTLGFEKMRRAALEMAVTVAAADGELSEHEEEAAWDLAGALGFDDDSAERLIERALRRAGRG